MEKIISSLKKKLDSYKLPDGVCVIPEFGAIKNSKETLYTNYSDAVRRYNIICDSLSKIQLMNVTIDKLLQELPKSADITFSMKNLCSDELKFLKTEVKTTAESYKTYKDGLEAVVNFYKSVQYILSSYRIEDV